MKYIVILGDGMADEPVAALNGKTPLEVANKPHIDYCAGKGTCGMANTIPEGMKPGSDVANLAVLGYNPQECYTGRAPLEALSIGVPFQDGDMAIRCNLVTLSADRKFSHKTMLDYSAGEITDYEATELMDAINKEFGNHNYKFYPGVSYRNCMVSHINKDSYYKLTPPHDISDKKISEYMPGDSQLAQLIVRSYEILDNHPINRSRRDRGLNPANAIWLWGAGTKPKLESFRETFGLNGGMISAVDLLKGIAIGSGMQVIEVEGATGKLDTNYVGKAKAAIHALTDGGLDYVYLHIEAPDECGHQGDADGKVKAIENIDSQVVAYILNNLKCDYTMLIMPDHATPLSYRTHTSKAVPFVIYRSNAEITGSGVESYTEASCAMTDCHYDNCEDLVAEFLFKNLPHNDNNKQKYEDNMVDTIEGMTDVPATDGAENDSEIITNTEDAFDSGSIIEDGGEISELMGVDSVINEEKPLEITLELDDLEEKGEFILPETIAAIEKVEEDQGLFDEGFVDPEQVTHDAAATENLEVLPAVTERESTDTPKEKKAIKAKQRKPKKPLTSEQKKKRLIAYIIIAVVAVCIIIASIVTPIMIINKDKIFVSKAADFGDVDKGNYYVMKNDVVVDGDLAIANPYSIDLQGHMLQVNGRLTFTHAQNNMTINIGTKKSKKFVSGGSIIAEDIQFTAAGEIIVQANIKSDNINIENPRKTTFTEAVSVNHGMTVLSGENNFNGIAFGVDAKLNIGSNADGKISSKDITVNIKGDAITDIVFLGSADKSAKYNQSSNAKIGSITMNEFVEARIHGAVNTNVTGGKKVIMTEKSSAEMVTGMKELWINEDNNNLKNIVLDGELTENYIINLATPQDINAELSPDARVLCSVTKVNNAARYSFRVGDNERIVETTEGAFGTITCDLTDIVTAAGEHRIIVTALGSADSDTDLIRPSKSISTTFTLNIKLEMPEELLINAQDGNIFLSWNSVRFADEYIIIINGNRITYREAAVNGRHSMNITQYMAIVGGYSVRIQARTAQNSAVIASEMAMTSYEITMPHVGEMALTYEIKEGALLLNWNKVDTASKYTLYKRSADGSITKYILPTNSITFGSGSYVEGDTFYVKANGIGYYQDTDVSVEVTINLLK